MIYNAWLQRCEAVLRDIVKKCDVQAWSNSVDTEYWGCRRVDRWIEREIVSPHNGKTIVDFSCDDPLEIFGDDVENLADVPVISVHIDRQQRAMCGLVIHGRVLSFIVQGQKSISVINWEIEITEGVER